MRIGLLFGSFNPVHTGHIRIAQYFTRSGLLDNIWFVVSPQNPFKTSTNLADENLRLQMVRLALQGYKNLEASDIEFGLERPSYTVRTLAEIRKKFPQHNFYLIIGEDNLHEFHLWKNYNSILEHHQVYVYRRSGFSQESPLAKHPRITVFDVPLLNISATEIRLRIAQGKPVSEMLPENIEAFIQEHNLYTGSP